MTEITNNAFMKLAVDTTKNRIYYAMRGFWQKPAEVPNYLQDWERALQLISKGFTIVTDAAQLRILSTEWAEIHKHAQKMVSDAGLAGTAEIVSESVLLKAQLNRMSKASGMPKELFATKEEAEAWLDSLSSPK